MKERKYKKKMAGKNYLIGLDYFRFHYDKRMGDRVISYYTRFNKRFLLESVLDAPYYEIHTKFLDKVNSFIDDKFSVADRINFINELSFIDSSTFVNQLPARDVLPKGEQIEREEKVFEEYLEAESQFELNNNTELAELRNNDKLYQLLSRVYVNNVSRKAKETILGKMKLRSKALLTILFSIDVPELKVVPIFESPVPPPNLILPNVKKKSYRQLRDEYMVHQKIFEDYLEAESQFEMNNNIEFLEFRKNDYTYHALGEVQAIDQMKIRSKELYEFFLSERDNLVDPKLNRSITDRNKNVISWESNTTLLVESVKSEEILRCDRSLGLFEF